MLIYFENYLSMSFTVKLQGRLHICINAYRYIQLYFNGKFHYNLTAKFTAEFLLAKFTVILHKIYFRVEFFTNIFRSVGRILIRGFQVLIFILYSFLSFLQKFGDHIGFLCPGKIILPCTFYCSQTFMLRHHYGKYKQKYFYFFNE